MLYLENFLAEITGDVWQRIDESHFVNSAARLARFHLEGEQVMLLIDDKPVYVGPLAKDFHNGRRR